MKFKYLLLSFMLLILVGSIAAIAADDDYGSLGDYTFDIPDGYQIKNCSDDYVLLESDQYHTISICALDANTNRNVLKYMLERSMYDFVYSSNYTKGDYDIEENHYNQEYQRGIVYLCDNGDELIVIDYKVPVIEEIEDSPVEVILDGLS